MKKFLMIILFFISSCSIFEVKKYPLIALKAENGFSKGVGNLISIQITSQNFPESFRVDDLEVKRCKTESLFAFTYSTPRKAPEIRRTINDTDIQYIENGRAMGRFKINKSNIYLSINNKKIYPQKIFIAQSTFDSISSNILAFKNSNRHTTHYISFPTPCSTLTTPNAKLIIEKIYKDNKPIKQNIEFGFTTQENNKIYQIWLE